MKGEHAGTLHRETGIYVVCNDKALLDTISDILRGSGIVGLHDRSGGIHYLVDARTDRINAAVAINNMIVGTDEEARIELPSQEPQDNETLINETIREVLLYYGFDMSLMGTQAISYLVKLVLSGMKFEQVGAKGMFQYVAQKSKTSFDQTERNVRYAVKKSRLADEAVRKSLAGKMPDGSVRG